MNTETQSTMEVVKLEKACLILNVSRSKFYKKYKNRLTHYRDNTKNYNLFSLQEVSDIAEEEKPVQSKKNVITEYKLIE